MKLGCFLVLQYILSLGMVKGSTKVNGLFSLFIVYSALDNSHISILQCGEARTPVSFSTNLKENVPELPLGTTTLITH